MILCMYDGHAVQACAEKQLAVVAYLEGLPGIRMDLKDLYGKVPRDYLSH